MKKRAALVAAVVLLVVAALSFLLAPRKSPLPRGEAAIHGRLTLADGSVSRGDVVMLARLPTVEDMRRASVRERVALVAALHKPERVAEREEKTDSTGAFVFEELPAGAYMLWAPNARAVVELEAKETKDVVLAARAPVVLAGYVRAASDGSPIEGAAIVALDRQLGGALDAETDAAGEFSIEGAVKDARYTFVVEHPGYVTHVEANVFPSHGIELELRAEASVKGVVLRDGQPVAGARVSQRMATDVAEPERAVITVSDGRFTIEAIEEGWHELTARTDHLRGSAQVEVKAGAGEDVTIELEGTTELLAIASAANGEPVAGAKVELDGSRDERSNSAAPFFTNDQERSTDGGGRARFELRAGSYTMVATHPEHGTVHEAVDVQASGDQKTIDLQFRGGSAVRGRVVGENETPIRDARVSLMHVQASASDDAPDFANTDAKGLFVFPGIAPGKWSLRVIATGYKQSITEVAKLDDHHDVEVELALERGFSIEGRVVDAADQPAPGYRISAIQDGRMKLPSVSFGDADDEGAFVIRGLDPGTYRVSAYKSGSSRRPPPVKADAGDRGVVIRTARPATLIGMVTFRGAPPPSEIKVRTGDRESTVAISDGRFQLDNIPDGEIVVDVGADGFARARDVLSLSSDAPVSSSFELIAEARVRGRVLDDKSSAPIEGAMVRAFNGAAMRTDATGHFDLRGLSAGEATVLASLKGRAPAHAGPFTLVAGQTIDGVELRMLRGVSIAGRIRRGAKAVKAFVSIDPFGLNRSPAETDGDGNFHLETVEPGKRQLIISSVSTSTRALQTTKLDVLVPSEGLPNLDLDLDLDQRAR